MKSQLTPEDAEMLRRTLSELVGTLRRGDNAALSVLRLEVDRLFFKAHLNYTGRKSPVYDAQIEDARKNAQATIKNGYEIASTIRNFIDDHEVKEG